jgi:hypothetical protein
MITTTTRPSWMEASPECEYWMKAFAPNDGANQEVELTLSEYNSLKTDLAKLRGLIPEDKTPAAQSPSDSTESDDPTIDPMKPGALTLARLVDTHENSIGILKAEILGLITMVNDGTIPKGYLLGRAFDAEILADVLQLWDTGGYVKEYPEDGSLLATMKERIGM